MPYTMPLDDSELEEDRQHCTYCNEYLDDCWCPEGGPDEMQDLAEDRELAEMEWADDDY